MFNFHFYPKLVITFLVMIFILTGCEKPPESPTSIEDKQINKPAPYAEASSVYPGWPVLNAIDGKLTTGWSSTWGVEFRTEWFIYNKNYSSPTNYIKILPRYKEGTPHAISWPKEFKIWTFDGTNWILSYSYTNFPPPTNNSWIYLPLLNTDNKNISKVKIEATRLSLDDTSNYVFQIFEIQPGYDPAYSKFKFIGNDLLLGSWNEIRNVGANSFDPNKISNWHHDYRNPLMEANPGPHRNIYAPSIVYNGTWNIYFGGWDGNNQNDYIFLCTTNDWVSFSPHYIRIYNGVFHDVNNASAIKVSSGNWRMMYTTGYDHYHNKPAYATSTDGNIWTPLYPDESYRITMEDYPGNWNLANVNGLNAIYYEANTYHLYFGDQNDWGGTYHATSPNGVNFQFQNTALTELDRFITDIKSFSLGQTKYYILAGGDWLHSVYASVSTNLNSFPLTDTLFSQEEWWNDDLRITQPGFVATSDILYGVLYGQCSDSEGWDNHVIKAAWLQKEVRFVNNFHTYGIGEKAYGPNKVRMEMASQIETGNFKVYDTNYNGNPNQTPIFTSPLLTMRTGDIWEYIP